MKLELKKRYILVTSNSKTGIAARAIRTQSGKSLRAVAKKMEISAPYLSDLELGRRPWSQKLVDNFNRSLS